MDMVDKVIERCTFEYDENGDVTEIIMNFVRNQQLIEAPVCGNHVIGSINDIPKDKMEHFIEDLREKILYINHDTWEDKNKLSEMDCFTILFNCIKYNVAFYHQEPSCCFCGEPIEGEGKDPQPLKDHGVCCDKCYAEQISDISKEKLGELEFTCCFCGKTFNSYGHNPLPLSEDGKCCDKCNTIFVMPFRGPSMRERLQSA